MQGRIIMKKAIVSIVLFASGVVLLVGFGLMLVMRKISLYQMNHIKAAH
jgi:hypothetical protein